MSVAAHAAVSEAAKQSHGRLVAWLAQQSGDLGAAQDAVSTAFEMALRRWPNSGVPQSPEAWLRTVAQRALWRAQRSIEPLELGLDDALLAPDNDSMVDTIPDLRLRLMLLCCHPALDPALHTALMLQCVLGARAEEIAAAMLLSPQTLSQRLVRAKHKIRAARLPMVEPQPADLPARLQPVLEAIYAAYGMAWDDHGAEHRICGLRDEAMWLASLVVQMAPASPEAIGLLALILFCESRRSARTGPQGEFIALAAQDCQRWDAALIGRAEKLLCQAAALRCPGPFQLEAAIQSAHCQRRATGQTPWAAIVTLYTLLLRHADSVGARVAQAVALREAQSPEAGLRALAAIDAHWVKTYQPWWVAQAELLFSAGRYGAARAALHRAIGLTTQPSLRTHLVQRLEVFDGAHAPHKSITLARRTICG